MSDPLPFLLAIAEAPRDAGLVLVFADWLEEQGDPRAAQVRAEGTGFKAASSGRMARLSSLFPETTDQSREVGVFHEDNAHPLAALETIAANSNRQVEAGTPCRIILYDTREVVGHAQNFMVAPWTADKHTIVADCCLPMGRLAEIRAAYPRQSVQLWNHGLYIDPVVLLRRSRVGVSCLGPLKPLLVALGFLSPLAISDSYRSSPLRPRPSQHRSQSIR